jgi:fatty-acyl-CoA synthase
MTMSNLAGDWVSHHARRAPDSVALEDADSGATTTWGQLGDRVARLAGVLVGPGGVRRGDRVAVLTESDTRNFELQFACMRIGAIYVPLNWRLSQAELSELTRNCAPTLVVNDHNFTETAELLVRETGPARRLSWGDAGERVELDFETELAHADAVGPSQENLLDQPSHILYTSGSTGTPKGVIITPANIVWNYLNSSDDKQIDGANCKVFNPLPLFHGGGLTALSLPILLAGGAVTVARRFDADQVTAALGDPSRGVTHLTGVFTTYKMITESPLWPEADLSGVKYLEMGGSRIPASLQDAFRAKGQVLQSVYGATETGPAVMQMPKEHAVGRPDSIGRKVLHTQVRLVTPEGRDATTGEIGEIWVSGPSVTSGYWGQEEARDTFFNGSWFRTGDAAYMDSEGFYYTVDRFKNMYKSGGENVFPAEAQAVLADHPDIAEIAIIGVADPRWGETGLAIIVSRGDVELTPADLAEFCADRLARYKVPTRVAMTASIPHNATGKLDLPRIRAEYQPRAVASESPA